MSSFTIDAILGQELNKKSKPPVSSTTAFTPQNLQQRSTLTPAPNPVLTPSLVALRFGLSQFSMFDQYQYQRQQWQQQQQLLRLYQHKLTNNVEEAKRLSEHELHSCIRRSTSPHSDLDSRGKYCMY